MCPVEPTESSYELQATYMNIPQDLLTPVAKWATANYRTFRKNEAGAGRYYTSALFGAPREIWEIKRFVMLNYEVPFLAKQEPVYRDFCGVNEPGAFVHPHQDSPPNHTRFNVMVQKAEYGGDPVLDGERIDLTQGDTWRCNAGRCTHGSTRVCGERLRIVLSFGFLL